MNYRFSTPIEYGEKTAFRTFDASRPMSLVPPPRPLLLPLLDRSDYPFDCTRARARRIRDRTPRAHLATYAGAVVTAGGAAPGPPDAPHRWPAPNGARAARRCRCEMGRGVRTSRDPSIIRDVTSRINYPWPGTRH